MRLKDWPVAERPREKLLRAGAQQLSDAELLALFIGSGGKGQDAVALGRSLLAHFGDLRALLKASPKALLARPGLGPARVALLLAARELGQRQLAHTMGEAETLSSPEAARRYLHACLRDLPHEVFVGLFLDNRHRVLHCEQLFRGTIDGASVYPREVVVRALELNAAALIVAHNHPSGVAEPSAADQSITRRLRDALSLVEIRLLDHLIIGDGEVVSLAERGQI